MSDNPNPLADDLLRLYVNAPGEAESARILERLVGELALPVIERTLRMKFRQSAERGVGFSSGDLEDLCNQSCLNLVLKLAAMRAEPDGNGIRDVRGYAAVVAYNVWHDFLNESTPNWKSLKNKIRYAIGRSEEIGLWSDSGEIHCGFASRERTTARALAGDEMSELLAAIPHLRSSGLPEIVFEILLRANRPLRLNDLVTVVARLWAVEDIADAVLDGYRENTLSGGNGQRDLEMRFELEQIWSEISQLPENQRTALLFNLRDEQGREMLFVFFNSGIANLKQIAAAMSLDGEEFSKVLPLLPFDDRTIADRMGITTKQVANLRKVARDNLRRRLAGKPRRNRRGGEK